MLLLRAMTVDLLTVREDGRELIRCFVHRFPQLHVLRAGIQIHERPALVVVGLRGIEIARDIARRIPWLHFADPANRDDNVRVVGIQMLKNGIDVGNFLK